MCIILEISRDKWYSFFIYTFRAYTFVLAAKLIKKNRKKKEKYYKIKMGAGASVSMQEEMKKQSTRISFWWI